MCLAGSHVKAIQRDIRSPGDFFLSTSSHLTINSPLLSLRITSTLKMRFYFLTLPLLAAATSALHVSSGDLDHGLTLGLKLIPGRESARQR
jgi:hypothetical protein